MKKIQQIIIRNTVGWKVLLFFTLTQIVYGTMLLFSIPKILEHSGGMKILDLMPTGYNSEYVHVLLETLGETGRGIYLFQQIPLDFIYPALFAVSYSLLLAYIFGKAFPRDSIFQKCIALPIYAGIFDYAENFGIIVMLSTYPNIQIWLVTITSIFSVIKSIFSSFTFILIIIGIIALLINKLRNNRSTVFRMGVY